jgi:hypothetical protein
MLLELKLLRMNMQGVLEFLVHTLQLEGTELETIVFGLALLKNMLQLAIFLDKLHDLGPLDLKLFIVLQSE